MKSLSLNGKERRTSAATLSEIVKRLALDPARLALERNGEIVHFVGGG